MDPTNLTNIYIYIYIYMNPTILWNMLTHYEDNAIMHLYVFDKFSITQWKEVDEFILSMHPQSV